MQSTTRQNTKTTLLARFAAPITLSTTLLAGIGFAAIAASTQTAEATDTLVVQDGTGHMVVDRADEPIRCGDQDIFYVVSRLKKGTVLQTAGESGSFTRVLMPDSIGAMVPAAEVEPGSSDTLIKLSVPSKLRAPSHLMGLSGAWKQLYTNALPAGTELEIIESITNEAGTVVGYRVKAPKSPAGEFPVAYILTESLRPALSSEIEGDNGDPIPPKEDPKPDPEPETNDPDPLPEPVVEDVTESTDDGRSEVDTSLLEEQVTEEPAQIENSAPVQSKPEPAVVRATQARIPTSKLESLETAFDNARTMPRAELDEALSELLAEFTRTRNDAGDDASLVRALDQRIEWINIRIETRDQRRNIARALAQYDAQQDSIAQAVNAWQEGRAYQLVGRMVTSSVYTGANLPLLYRVQGTDPITGQPQTIGYIAPKQDQDLRHMLGRVVGVLGVFREDAQLGLRIVEPERVDLMPN